MKILRITFKEIINTRTLEETLRKFYKNSKDDEVSEAEFNFEAVAWCEAFQLSLIVLWISELLETKKKVTFVPPSFSPLSWEKELSPMQQAAKTDNRVSSYSFLIECKFIDFLLSKDIISKEDLEGHKANRREKPLESRISPLVFFSIAKDFQNFMARIYDQYRLQFGPIIDVEVVRKGEIRDIILRELGDNIFDHGNGRFGHILMTLKGSIEGTDRERKIFRDLNKRNVSEPESTFFNSLGDSGYLTIVVSDKGPGIWHRLRKEYIKDSLIADKKVKPTEAQIIDYAFLQHSTSKGHKKRLGALKELIEKWDLKETMPGTGLFWVREVVKAYNGLLLIRSGRSFVCYDFLTYPNHGHPSKSLLTNSTDKSTKVLENFEGTQIKICFPTHVFKHKDVEFSFLIDLPPTNIKTKYEYINLDPNNTSPDDSEKLARWLDEHRNYLQKIKLSSGIRKTVLIDCKGWELAEEKALKALYLLVVEMMRMQGKNFTCILLNGKGVLDRIGRFLTEVANSHSGIPKEKPILAFDEEFNMSVYGLSETDARRFSDILHTLIESSNKVSAVLEPGLRKRIEHLINYDLSTHTAYPLFSISEIKGLVRENIRKGLESVILNPRNKIYHSEGCFLIPSGAYSEGYFELHRLQNGGSWRQDIIKWLRYGIESLRPNTIVTIGKSFKNIGESVRRYIPGMSHMNIGNTRSSVESIRVALLPKNDKIILFTDVIGTQRSLNAILKECSKVDVRAIFTVVDARNDAESKSIKYDGKSFHLESIVKQPIQFWYEDKPARYTYEEIIRIDPVSNSPILPIKFTASERTLWKGVDESTGKNAYLEDVIKESNAIVIGHFESNERHILYLFLTSAIAKSFGTTIADQVLDDIKLYSEIEPNMKYSISHVLYPNHTPAADEIARQIALGIEGSKIVGLSPKEIKLGQSFQLSAESTTNVIIFDDASGTGYNIRQMVEIAERCSARSIFVYILCNRAEQSVSRSIQKVQKYGKSIVHTRYLCELAIPTFPPTDCPVCKSISRLERLKSEVKNPDILSILEKEISGLQKQQVTNVVSPDTAAAYISTPLDERLIQTDLRSRIELSKHSLPVRKWLAELVSNYEQNKQEVLLFLAAISYEESYFLKIQVVFDEVFYESFKKHIIRACKHFLDNIQDLSELQVLSVISAFRIFDPDSLLDKLDGLHTNFLSERLFERIMMQFLLSDHIRQKAAYVTRILRRWEASPKYTSINPFIKLWSDYSRPSTKSQEIFTIYRRISNELGDSSYCAHQFAGLEYNKIASMDILTTENLVYDYWKPISNHLKNRIFPDLREIAYSGISAFLCEELQEQVALATGLLYKADELADAITNHSKTHKVRETAKNGFCIAVTELHKLILEDEIKTVPRILRSFRTELTRVVRKVLSLRMAEFEEHRINLETDIPDDSRLVFGHEVDVYSVIDIILENIFTRAFNGVEKDNRRLVGIRIVEGPEPDTTSLLVLDSGRGVGEEIRYGVGLSTVDEICRKICFEWDIRDANDAPFKTSVEIIFHSSQKRELW